MACSNTIIIVNSNVVNSNYLQQQAAALLAEITEEFNQFLAEHEQIKPK